MKPITERRKAITAAVAKSAPNPDRPRISEEYERKLHDSDRARAACYAEMEEITEMLKDVADDLSADDLPRTAIPVEIDEETSLVTAIADLTTTLSG